MCILIATTTHPDYKLILLSNRDERVNRATAKAEFWPSPHSDILSPLDLERSEHGTWIGISKSGRLAVVLNYVDHTPPEGDVSRGLFSRSYLTSALDADAWIEQERQKHGEKLELAGGFTMVCGNVKDINSLKLFSNRGDHGQFLDQQDRPTACLSNSLFREPWPKAILGRQFLDKLIADRDPNWSEDDLVEQLFQILYHDTFPIKAQQPMESIQHSIFIPVFAVDSDKYATRTSTIILIDKDSNVRYIERTLDDGSSVEYKFKVE